MVGGVHGSVTIKEAIASGKEKHGLSIKELEYKLGGLLGEAAYLDPNHLPAAIEFNKSLQRTSLALLQHKPDCPEVNTEKLLDGASDSLGNSTRTIPK